MITLIIEVLFVLPALGSLSPFIQNPSLQKVLRLSKMHSAGWNLLNLEVAQLQPCSRSCSPWDSDSSESPVLSLQLYCTISKHLRDHCRMLTSWGGRYCFSSSFAALSRSSHRTPKICLPALSASCYWFLTLWLCCCINFCICRDMYGCPVIISAFCHYMVNYFHQLILKPAYYGQVKI